jgi:mRNA-degrading endonuclease RelE of RelBE toxin-antitoxin system
MATYTIEFAASVEKHLRSLTARDRRIVLDGIEQSLTHQPMVETRHRKPMRPNPLAAWELRLGNLRVYYRVVDRPRKLVEIAAIGVKRRNQIWIGGDKVDL